MEYSKHDPQAIEEANKQEHENKIEDAKIFGPALLKHVESMDKSQWSKIDKGTKGYNSVFAVYHKPNLAFSDAQISQWVELEKDPLANQGTTKYRYQHYFDDGEINRQAVYLEVIRSKGNYRLFELLVPDNDGNWLINYYEQSDRSSLINDEATILLSEITGLEDLAPA